MKISREENLQLTNDDNFRRIVREEEEVFSMADVGANICGKVSHYACRDVRIVVDRLPDLGQKMSQVLIRILYRPVPRVGNKTFPELGTKRSQVLRVEPSAFRKNDTACIFAGAKCDANTPLLLELRFLSDP